MAPIESTNNNVIIATKARLFIRSPEFSIIRGLLTFWTYNQLGKVFNDCAHPKTNSLPALALNGVLIDISVDFETYSFPGH